MRELTEVRTLPRPHWPCPGDHMHVFEMNQNPATCQCFPREKEVVCL